jgi:tRNA modification GTPase
MQGQGDTIAAVATPLGLGGIGIVRMSGPGALEILGRIFEPARPLREIRSRRLYLGYIRNPETGLIVDQVLACAMKAPFSYTGEDVVEINTHSGPFLLSTILNILVSQGARTAGPGEFTFRAFMNGRIDLSQAEAVLDLCSARSEEGMSAAASQLKGALGGAIRRIKETSLAVLAEVEAAIDFPDEAETGYRNEDLLKDLEESVLAPLREILKEGQQGRFAVVGARTAIVGGSNAGKSSLFNRLLKKERAIVTPVPGTTRDVIESEIILNGLPVRLMDTAGIREAQDHVEKIGMGMTQKAIEESDLLLFVLDRSRPFSRQDFEIMDLCLERKTIIVLNKSDLPAILDKETLMKRLPARPVIELSALTGDGVKVLEEAISEELRKDVTLSGHPRLAPNLRQSASLKEALEAFARARECLKGDVPAEITALELRAGLESLNQITGENLGDEVLNEIFSRFCIGK